MTLGSLVRYAEDRVMEGGEAGSAAEEVIERVKGWLEEACGGRGWRERGGNGGDGEEVEGEGVGIEGREEGGKRSNWGGL